MPYALAPRRSPRFASPSSPLAPLAPSSLVACAPAPCEHLTDCPGSLVCSSDGRCVANEAPVFLGGSGGAARVGSRASPDDALAFDVDIAGGFAGNINGTSSRTRARPSRAARRATSPTSSPRRWPAASVGMWFDIPMPTLLPVGTPRVFTLEEMFADGSLPCIQLWSDDGTSPLGRRLHDDAVPRGRERRRAARDRSHERDERGHRHAHDPRAPVTREPSAPPRRSRRRR